jgi:hypothetical protein
MTTAAYQTQFRQEFIAGFEDRSMIKGNQARFLVADSGSATAETRGPNGLIPARADNLVTPTATLQEWHDLVRRTDFNIFASQGDARRIMQMTTMGVVNRKIDDIVIAQLDTVTNDTGAAQIASLDLWAYARTILGNSFVDLSDEDNLFALVSPAFDAYMMQVPEFASSDYVDVRPLTGPARRFRRWGGFNWMVHPRLTGSVGAGGDGTSEQCFFYHRNAIGCAIDRSGIDTSVGFDDEQAYTFARVSVHLGAVLLQQSGAVMVKHDASGYVAQ